MSADSPAALLIKSDGTEIATATNPVRTDPTGTTTQPVSGTVTGNQGTAAATANAWPTKVTDGTTVAHVAPASTAVVATDPALVVALSQNSAQLNPSVAANDGAFPEFSTQVGAPTGSSFGPDPNNIADGPLYHLTLDSEHHLNVRGPVHTDEASFRDDFTGSSLTTALTGTFSFTSGSPDVTGAGTLFTTELNRDSYIKKSSDSETLYVRIAEIIDDTTLILDAPYGGSTAGSSAVESHWSTSTPSGGSITVGSSTVTLAPGTTNGNRVTLRRSGDYLPYSLQYGFSISQRIANQETRVGLMDDDATPTKSACIVLSGTDNTKVIYRTQASADAADTEETLITLPSGTTVTNHNYHIVVTGPKCTLYIDDVLVADHRAHIPGPYDVMDLIATSANSNTVTATTFGLDYAYFSNTDIVQTATDIGETNISANLQVTPVGEIQGNIDVNVDRTLRVVGKSSDNSTNSTEKQPVVDGVANAADPTWTEGRQVPASVNLTGHLRTSPNRYASGTLGALNATVSVSLEGLAGVGMVVTSGNLQGTVTPELSFDAGTTWVATTFTDPATSTTSATVAIPGATVARSIAGRAGATHARVRVSNYTSGSSTGFLVATSTADQSTEQFAGNPGSATQPFAAAQVAGWDGANLRVLKTATDGTLRVDPSGTTAQPVTDNAGSLTVDSAQLPAALVSGRLDVNVGAGTVTANVGTTNGLALDATLTGGTQQAIARGGAKGATTSAVVTSTAEGTDHQALDVQIMHGGAAKDPTQVRALTSSDVVTAVQATATNLKASVEQATAANLNATVVQSTAANLNATVTAASAFPVTDNAGSLTVDSAQLPAALVSGRLDVNVGAGTVTANIGTSGSLALDATLTGGSQVSKITDGSNTVAVMNSNPTGTEYGLVVRNAGGASGGTSSSFGAAFPSSGTAMGVKDSAGTNMTFAKVNASNQLVIEANQATAGNLNATVVGTVTANAGTNLNTSLLALDTTLTGGTTKAITRGGAKGATAATDVTSTTEGTDHQALDVQIYHGSAAVNPTQIRALTNADVVTAAQATAANLNATVVGTGTLAVQDSQVLTDNGAFTDGTSKVFTAGYVFDEVAGTSLTENDAAAARIDSKRAQVLTIEDATTRGQRLAVGATGAASTNITQYGGTVVGAANAVHVQPGTGASFTVAQATAANLNATVAQSTAANLRTQTSAESATGSAGSANAMQVGGAVTTAAPTYVTGNLGALSLTTTGQLRAEANYPGGTSSFNVSQGTAANLRAQLASEAALGSAPLGTSLQMGVVALNATTSFGNNQLQYMHVATQTGGLRTHSVSDVNAGGTAPSYQTVVGALATTAPGGLGNGTSNPLRMSTAGLLFVDGSQATQPVSGTVTAAQATASSLNATVVGTGTFAVQDSEKIADNTAFTDGTSKVLPAGFIFDEVAGTALTENDAAAARIDSKRAQILAIEDATTRGQRLAVSAAGAAATNIAQYLGATVGAANAVHVQPGTGASFTVAQSTAASLKTESVGTLTNNNAIPAATNIGALTVLANAAAPSFTEGRQTLISSDLTGNVRTKGISESTTGSTAPTSATLVGGTDGTNIRGILADANGRQVVMFRASASALTNVTSSATTTTVLASNSNRIGATVYNDSTQALYLKLGATASTTSFTVKLSANDYYEVPFGYTGVIDGIWASANGFARVTEITN